MKSEDFRSIFGRAKSLRKVDSKGKRSKSRDFDGADAIARILAELKLPFEREFRFHPTRKWRSDFAIPVLWLLIEFDGGTWIKAGHSTGTGLENDREKDQEAAIAGYRTMRFTKEQVRLAGNVRDKIERYILQERKF